MSRIKPGYLKRWANVIDKPATATRWPAFGEVTGKPATATRWPAWNEVTNKPTIVGNSGAGQVGTYAFAGDTRGKDGNYNEPGGVVAGSNLRYASAAGIFGGALPGTWRCMGRCVKGGEEPAVSVWLRIS